MIVRDWHPRPDLLAQAQVFVGRFFAISTGLRKFMGENFKKGGESADIAHAIQLNFSR